VIKNISAGQGLTVTGNMSWPYIYNNNNPEVGSMRYDGQTRNIMVFDGNNWIQLSTSYPLIEISPDVHELLMWVKQKRDREERIKELANSNSSIADANRKLNLAKEQLDILVALTDNHKNNGDLS
jgi:hypothetical protein